MAPMHDQVSWLGAVVFALACTNAGDDGSTLGSGGATSAAGAPVAGAPAAGAAGVVHSNAGDTSISGGAGMAFGGRAGSASGGAGASSGSGGVGAGAGGVATTGGTSNEGGMPARAGNGGRRGGFGGGAGLAGSSAMAGSSGAAGSSGGASSAGAGGACVENLDCTLTAAPLTDDIHQDCVDRINQFRTQCACLPPLARWTEGEACADQMSEYDAMQNMAHAGFEDKICGNNQGGQNECPGYSSNSQVITLCLQQMWSEGPGPEDPCDGQCFQDHGHFINMTSTSSTKVACGFYTTSSGKVWAAQNFAR